MTTKQIQAILGSKDLNYSTDKLIQTPKIAIISSDLDGPIYPGETTKLNFNTTDQNLEIYYGKKIRGEVQFNENIPSFVIPFANLYGITLVGPLHRQEPYKTGQAV